MWQVYLLENTAHVSYIGITTDLPRRLKAHNGERAGGAKSTRRGRPWHVQATLPPMRSMSDALRMERRLKRVKGLAARLAAFEEETRNYKKKQ